jgi:hypothetical protein
VREVDRRPFEDPDLLCSGGAVPGDCIRQRIGRLQAPQQPGELCGARDPIALLRVVRRQTDRTRGVLECQFAVLRPPVKRASGVDDRADPRAREPGPPEAVDCVLEIAASDLIQTPAPQVRRQSLQRGIEVADRLLLVGMASLVQRNAFETRSDEELAGFFEPDVGAPVKGSALADRRQQLVAQGPGSA